MRRPRVKGVSVLKHPVFEISLVHLQGWIDNTYMNQEGTFRLARGNKGELATTENIHRSPAPPLRWSTPACCCAVRVLHAALCLGHSTLQLPPYWPQHAAYPNERVAGTLFVLVRPPQEGTPLETQLLEAIEGGDDSLILSLVGLLQTENPTRDPAEVREGCMYRRSRVCCVCGMLAGGAAADREPNTRPGRRAGARRLAAVQLCDAILVNS